MKRFSVLVPRPPRMGGTEQGVPPQVLLLAPCETWYAARYWFSIITGIAPGALPAIALLPEEPRALEDAIDAEMKRLGAAAALWVPPPGAKDAAPAGYGRLRGVNGRLAQVTQAWLERALRGLNGVEHLLGDG